MHAWKLAVAFLATILAIGLATADRYAAAAASYQVTAPELSPAFNQCISTHTTNIDWSQCSNQEISRQEERLSQAWRTTFAAMQNFSPKTAALLLHEQRAWVHYGAWVHYKDAACQYYASGAFGEEGKALDYGVCKATLIAQRIDSLKVLAKDAEQQTSSEDSQ